MTNPNKHRINAAELLANHLNEVEDALLTAVGTMTPRTLMDSPALASGVAALFRERRESLAAVVVAHENARHAARRGGAA